ncbi:hypothetical protein CVO74_11865 [Xanthomonas prunicola]|uniref:Lipoprotein n=1 Tax=Xanthomonas prunicola TaxID=2053930 RepID=A0A2N3RLW8_9XANT|nr:hypothetical protein XpruCFBP8353_09810 [Xanthomonas prunicola]PKV17757.1 hypothetical protein XpruCFBP8354_09810 [Xanthomonas prunicola]PKV21654.1 hypothetical protein CVO74_11865 [Xanthomonas prunicola]
MVGQREAPRSIARGPRRGAFVAASTSAAGCRPLFMHKRADSVAPCCGTRTAVPHRHTDQ